MLGLKRSMLSAGLRLRALGKVALFTLLLLSEFGVPAASAKEAAKVVRYRSFRILVPASWPVFNLTADPHACVRFDRHALYLGRPGAEQRCPAHAVGHTEAILVSPLTATSGRAGGLQRSALPGLPGPVARFAVPARRVVVTATWESDPAAIRHALEVRSLHSNGITATASPAGARAGGPVAHASAAYTGLGFDACSAPSASQMAAWGASPYRAVGIYIGGANRACSQYNLTASWVSAESGAGWQFIPIYVGLQAPGACGCAAINLSNASAEGAAAASDAVNQAEALGIGAGNPIYDDMEGYSRGATNTASVLAFVSGWTSQLHAEGYLSGVYSSADSGVRDLAARWGTGYAEPDDIWFARWNDAQSTSDPSLPPGDWAAHQRLHQYTGSHDESYGGVTLNIDGNYLDGASAGSTAFLPDGTFVQVDGVQGVYRIAGGAPLYVTDPYMVLGSPIETITQQQFDSLPTVPRDGTFLQSTNTTTPGLYRIAGGAPLYISNRSLFSGVQPFVTIDQWDIDNITNPLAHLNAMPANGTFLTTTSGQIYRIAGGAPFRISGWRVFHHPQPSVLVDQWDIDNISNPAAHLRTRPVDGTVVEALPSHWYWSFAGGWRQLGSATPQAIKVDDSGVKAFAGINPLPAPKCTVPRLHHLTFQNAKRALSTALCSLGKVRRPRRWGRNHRLRVYWQIPGSKKTYPEGHRVGIKMK